MALAQKKHKVLLWGFLSLLALGVTIRFLFVLVWSPNTQFEDQQVIYIPTGADQSIFMDRVAPYLKNPSSFERFISVRQGWEVIKPGKYTLKSSMNNLDMYRKFRQGSETVKVVFNNQDRLELLAGRVGSQIEADSVSLMNAWTDPQFLADKKLTKDQVLAIFLPNSYEFFWNTDATSFRDRMWTYYEKYWTSERRELAQQQGLTPIEVSCLAAVVHKETVQSEERARVAGVYLNRLRIGMKLQADPTVIFAIKYQSNNFDQVIKRVFHKDLLVDSPFNTYRYKGVPPGLIAMPDLSAIEAVLQPESHNYLFFVADPSKPGYHRFSTHYGQHINQSKSYVRWVDRLGIDR